MISLGRIETLLVLTAGIIVMVILAALATGTADDLPWGAIILAAIVLLFGWVTSRKRARALAQLDDDDRDQEGLSE